MMKVELVHRMLRVLDLEYELGVEEPADFNYEGEVRHVKRIRLCLEKRLGISLELDAESFQDSYFFAEIQYKNQGQRDPDMRLNIRFSCFGKMVSAWIRDGIPTEVNNVLAVIEEVVESNGYVYADSDWLIHTRYDGYRYPDYAGNMSWWRRFFDYI